MKYKMGEIEVEGTPEEIAEFLSIGSKAKAPKPTKPKQEVPKVAHYAVKLPRRATRSTDYKPFFGGKNLSTMVTELGLTRPTNDIVEALCQHGLPRDKKSVLRAKQMIWVLRSKK
jgi:hypothetical protein